MENKRPTQCDMIMNYMETYGSITALQAITDLGCMRLASRISELRGRGVKIAVKSVKVKKRMGGYTNIAEYSLAE